MHQQTPIDQSASSSEALSHGWLRLAGAVLAGILAGALFANGLGAGARVLFSAENTAQWGFFWGDHWVFRSFASGVAAIWGGFIAGVIGRRHGGRLGLLATIPGALVWAVVSLAGWGLPLRPLLADLHIPLGYKLGGTALVLGIPVGGWFGGNLGAPLGREYSEHFDQRRHTLLGIKWYHYLWVYFPFQFLMMSLTVSWIYGFEWMKVIWQSGLFGFDVLVSSVFAGGVFMCISLLWKGGRNTYLVLAGFRDVQGAEWGKALVKYALGYPLGAALLQAAIIALHAWLVSLIG